MSLVYREREPELVKRNIPSEEVIQGRARSLSECGYFEEVVVRTYPWSACYKTADYLGLLNTYSDHLRLAVQRRRALFEEIAEGKLRVVLDRQFSLANAADAHAYIESRQAVGRVVLNP